MTLRADRHRPPGLSFLGRKLPTSFERRIFVVPPGARHDIRPAEWGRTLIVVERGHLELVLVTGRGRQFTRGDVLYLDGLPAARLENESDAHAVLSAVRRRSAPGR